jgi:hypothetical protein
MVSGKESPRWTPPEALDSPSDDKPVPPPPPKNPARDHRKIGGEDEETVQLDLSYLQKSVRRMEAASAKIVLERLTEEWTEIPDAAMYTELLLEKKLWMRTALHTSCQERSFKSDVSPDLSIPEPPGSDAKKLLSLYEDHGKLSPGFCKRLSHAHDNK